MKIDNNIIIVILVVIIGVAIVTNLDITGRQVLSKADTVAVPNYWNSPLQGQCGLPLWEASEECENECFNQLCNTRSRDITNLKKALRCDPLYDGCIDFCYNSLAGFCAGNSCGNCPDLTIPGDAGSDL